jgi:hypothetical protein
MGPFGLDVFRQQNEACDELVSLREQQWPPPSAHDTTAMGDM